MTTRQPTDRSTSSQPDSSPNKSDEIRKIHRYGFISAALWTLLLSGLFLLHLSDNRLAVNEALSHTAIWLIGICCIWFGTQKIVRVMTQLRSDRASLIESEGRLRELFTRAGDGIFILSADGRLSEVNESMARMHGYSVEEMQQMELKELDTLEAARLAPERMKKILAGESLVFEVEHYHKDGHIFPMEVSASLFSKGEKTYIQCFHRDISQRKQGEKALLELKDELLKQNKELHINKILLHEQNDALQATEEMLRVQIREYEFTLQMLQDSEARFKTLYEASFGGIAIHDRGIILDCNHALSDITGFSIEELDASNRFNLLDLIAPESVELVTQNITNDIESRYEVQGLRKDGTKYPLALRGKNIPYKGSTVRVTEFRDFTERKRVEVERLQLEQQFHHAQKFESLGVLAGGIAHDFNNILTIILGHCYMAREDFIPETEYKTAFLKIETASTRAAELCRQLLTYAGRSPMEQTRVDLALLIDEVVKMLQAAINKNVSIVLDMQRVVPEIKGDTAQIQQVIMNLIINAAEAIGDREGTIRVSLTKTILKTDKSETDTFGTLIKSGGYVCLEVTDTGCGMDEQTQKRIFEPFYTTKFTGRGLGMSAIRGIVIAHEATLNLTSAPGVGTTFNVCFPLLHPADYVEIPPATSIASEKGGGRVLLVDDEEFIRSMGTDLLESMGFTVLTAGHGREALELYHERGSEIDLILLDLTMPIMGGIEAYKELRKINSTLPVIICSGYSLELVEHIIKNDPHAEFVHKPYKPGELRDVIGKMIGQT